MDLWTALFTVFRRWYVSLPIAALAVVGMVVIGGRIAQEYETHASVVLVPPPAKVIGGVERRPDNPLDAKTAATATAKQIDSTSTMRRFDDEGLSPDFTVNLDSDTAIIEYLVKGKSADQALDTAQRLIDETKGNLARIQQVAGAQDDAFITLNTVDISDEAEPIKGDKLRVQATVLLLGVVAAVSAAFIVESFQARRRGGRGGALQTPGAGVPLLTGYAMPQVGGGYALGPASGAQASGYPAMASIPPGYVPLVPMAQAPGVPAPVSAEAAAPSPGDPALYAPETEADVFGSVDDLLERDGGNGVANGHGSQRRSASARSINAGKRPAARDDVDPDPDLVIDLRRPGRRGAARSVANREESPADDASGEVPFDHATTDPEAVEHIEEPATEPVEADAEVEVEVEPIEAEADDSEADDSEEPAEAALDVNNPADEPDSAASEDAATAVEANDEPAVDTDDADDITAEATPRPGRAGRGSAKAADAGPQVEEPATDRQRAAATTSGRPSRARRPSGGGGAAATKRQPRTDHNSGAAGKERRSSLFASGSDGSPAGNDG